MAIESKAGIDAQLGELARTAADSLGISGSELSRRLGLKGSGQISRFFNGKGGLKVENLRAIFHELETGWDDGERGAFVALSSALGFAIAGSEAAVETTDAVASDPSALAPMVHGQRPLAATNQDARLLCRVLLREGQQLVERAQFELAKIAYSAAITAADRGSWFEGKAAGFVKMAEVARCLNDLAQAQVYTDRAMGELSLLGSGALLPEPDAESPIDVEIEVIRRLQNNDEAIKVYGLIAGERGLIYQSDQSDPFWLDSVSTTMMNLGNAFNDKDMLAEAHERKARLLRDRATVVDLRGAGWRLPRVGVESRALLVASAHELDMAMKYRSDPKEISHDLRSLATVRYLLGDRKGAHKAEGQALALLEEIKSPAIIHLYDNQATWYIGSREFQLGEEAAERKAETSLNKVSRMAVDIKSLDMFARAQAGLGLVYANKGGMRNTERALAFLATAIIAWPGENFRPRDLEMVKQFFKQPRRPLMDTICDATLEDLAQRNQPYYDLLEQMNGSVDKLHQRMRKLGDL